MHKLEALADSIAALNSYADPESEAYKIRNPGMLKAFTLDQPMDDDGRRVFKSHVAGYAALLADLGFKVGGKSRSKLKSTSTIEELLVRGYSQPAASAAIVACFLAQALTTKSISESTPLSYFQEL